MYEASEPAEEEGNHRDERRNLFFFAIHMRSATLEDWAR
jgi:hypothetical protein